MKTTTKFRILVIDDNVKIHDDFKKVLCNTSGSTKLVRLESALFDVNEKAPLPSLPPFSIDTASQGLDGVVLVAKSIEENAPYSVAFVDIRMPPGIDGVETIRKIWEIDKDIQVVITTAYSDYSWDETVSQLGINDNLLILKKPFEPLEIRQLATALSKKWILTKEVRSTMRQDEMHKFYLESELKYRASHDPVSGLPNFEQLIERMKVAIADSSRSNRHFAVIYFDIDHFRMVNDDLGYVIGDDLLKIVAKRLQSAIRVNDLVTRVRADEFVFVLSNISHDDGVMAIVDKINKIIEEPYTISNKEVIIQGSMGICLYPRDGSNVNELLHHAELAMYQAKIKSGLKAHFYSKSLNDRSSNKLEMSTNLRNAIKNNEFVLYYQPKFNAQTKEIIGAEALIRWQSSTGKLIQPNDFIPLAEETGLITAIGDWVIKTACLQIKSWQDMGLPKIAVAVNVAEQQIKQPDFLNKLKIEMEQAQVSPNFVEIELTENIIFSSTVLINSIATLKELGIRVVLDDFGTGYSSLSNLTKIPVDVIKIDKSFVQKIGNKMNDEFLIKMVIAIAKQLNLDVVAEGVETQEQLDFLLSQGCKIIQGFLFCKPIAADEFEKLLRSQMKPAASNTR